MSPTPTKQPNYTTQVNALRIKKPENISAAGSRAAKLIASALDTSSCGNFINPALGPAADIV
jgi:hypothetical protein